MTDSVRLAGGEFDQRIARVRLVKCSAYATLYFYTDAMKSTISVLQVARWVFLLCALLLANVVAAQETKTPIDPASIFGQGEPMSNCLLYTSPSPRDQRGSRMPSSA